MQLLGCGFALGFILAAKATQVDNSGAVSAAIDKLCTSGNVYQAVSDFQSIKDSAQAYHSLAALELVLNANVDMAVALHKQGKSADPTVIPPLAKRHIDKLQCAGLDELFYVAAVIIKELVDTNKALPNVVRAYKTLITIASDVGLDQAAESLLVAALTLAPKDTSLLFRAAVLTPGVYESMEHIHSTRALLEHRIDRVSDAYSDLTLTGLDEFVLSPTFYFVYQGYNDKSIMTNLQYGYTKAHPRLGNVEIIENVHKGRYLYQQPRHNQATSVAANTESVVSSAGAVAHPRKIRVGFVSSYFRRHSICKLFCGVMTGLDQNLYEVFAFSSMRQNEEDKVTLSLRHSHIQFVSVGMTFIQNRNEVTDRAVDILVYLDVGMDPSIAAWAAARLAPIQMVIWGHPSTTGYASIDYYLSSDKFHRHRYVQYSSVQATGTDTSTQFVVDRTGSHAYDAFAEQLVLFDALGFYFERPLLETDITKIGADISAESEAQRRIEDMSPDAIPSAVDGTSEGLAAAPAHMRDNVSFSELSSDELALVHRPVRYYEALRDKLRTYKTAAAAQIIQLIDAKLIRNASIALCPQHMPKFHPHFDTVLMGILTASPSTRIVLIDNKKKQQWRLTLTERWGRTLTEMVTETTTITETESRPTTHAPQNTKDASSKASVATTVEALLSRIVWVSAMTPQEYLHLLAVGDVMLDPFPFGGGVTTLESVAVCTPVVTWPSAQSVPQLAAGMLYHMEMHLDVERLLIVPGVAEYLHSALSMLRSAESNRGAAVLNVTHLTGLSIVDIRREVCNNAHKLYNSSDALQDWNVFLSSVV